MLPFNFSLKVHKSLYFVTSLLLARNFLLAFTVQFSRCRCRRRGLRIIRFHLSVKSHSLRRSSSSSQTRFRWALLGFGSHPFCSSGFHRFPFRSGRRFILFFFKTRLKYSALAKHFNLNLKEVVGPSGLEPPTSRLSVVRSSQLSYGPVRLDDVRPLN